MNSIEVLLREYEAIRKEVLATMENRTRMLMFGLLGVCLIFSATLLVSQDANGYLPALMLVILVPIINTYVLFIWLGEYERMQRAGKFLVEIEARINEYLSEEVLSWETGLRKQKRHMKYPYNNTVIFLITISLISLFMGLNLLQMPVLWTIIILSVSVLLLFVEYMYVSGMIGKLRQ